MSYDDTVNELSGAVKKHVRFKNARHAEQVAMGRTLPMDDDITRFVIKEAERLYEEFSGGRVGQVLGTVGIANPDKGRDCRGTKLSALREAIYSCASQAATKLRKEQEAARRKKWRTPDVTTDVWLYDEPRHPDTVRFGIHEDDLFELADDPLDVVPIVEARHSA